MNHSVQFSSVQSLSHVRIFVLTWIAARQAALSITNSQSSNESLTNDNWCHQFPVRPFSHTMDMWTCYMIPNNSFIALQYCTAFGQISTWIIHRYTYVPSFFNLLATFLSISTLEVVTEKYGRLYKCVSSSGRGHADLLSIISII